MDALFGDILGIMRQVQRKEYTDRLDSYRGKHIIKVITGARRCGKSTLLKMYSEKLRTEGIDESRIVFINLEDYDNVDLLDPAKLHGHIRQRKAETGMTYVFLDEIQNVDSFQKVVDSLFLDESLDIYMTGSNAYFLSGELATLLSGRYVTIDMLPLSLREFIEINSDSGEHSRAEWYRRYVQVGSFPYASAFSGDLCAVHEYLRGVYNTIVLKDVVARYRITDTKTLESIARFLFDNIGSPLSSKRIADTLTSSGRRIDPKTVEKYISALQESFILYEAKRYDVKGKQYLKLMEKYYLVDIGLMGMLLGQRSMDVGHVLENIVYLELLRRRYDVYVGKLDDNEIDFVAQNNDGNSYFQVAASVRDAGTLERELKPLRGIKDSYPKVLLTLDEDPVSDYDGIKRMCVLDWLLG